MAVFGWWARWDLSLNARKRLKPICSAKQGKLQCPLDILDLRFKSRLSKQNKKTPKRGLLVLVGEVGLEPTRLIQPTDFKSVAYTNSATRPDKYGGALEYRLRLFPVVLAMNQSELCSLLRSSCTNRSRFNTRESYHTHAPICDGAMSMEAPTGIEPV